MRFRRVACALLTAVLVSAVLASRMPLSAQFDFQTLRIIVVSSREEAQRLLARVRNGEDFAALARAASLDPSASDGGLLGRVAISTLRPDLQTVLRGLDAGKLTPIMQIPTGFAFMRVEHDTNVGPTKPLSQALLATGNVKYVIDVGGLPEAETVLREYTKPATWNQNPRSICQTRVDSLTSGRVPFDNFFSPRMEAIRKTRTPFELMQAHLGLAQLQAYEGDLSQALPHFQEALQLAIKGVPDARMMVEEMLGLAHFHKAEMDNGVYRTPGELCLIPTPPGRSLAKTEDADKAIEHLLSYLKQKPEELEVRWLLNLAYMMSGRYPDSVPPQFLIPPSAFQSTEDVGRFVDVAPQAGLNVFASAGGVIVDDLANTGRFDVVTSNFYSCGPLHYFGNNGDGTFTERTAAAGLSNQVGGLNIIQTDYNNDGCKDILVLRGGWEVAQQKSLLKNNCNGTFTDVTTESGLANRVTATQTAAWTDINNDGLLDLFIGNEDSPSQLFLNKGNNTFEDISHSAHIDRFTFAKAVTAADYDNDGFPDLYVSNYDGPNILYHNNRDNTFTDVTEKAGVPGAGRGFAAWFFDYDNDGWPDLFATSYFMSADETARTYLGLPHNATTLKLYRNLGNGTFRDVTSEVGLNKVFMPMGSNFGDLDNDGFLDIYLGMGTPSYASVAPHVLLRNKGGRSFVDVTASSGTGELHKGHGIAFVDLDNDGDEDIVAEIGGATPADSHAMRVFENPGHGNDWISLKLIGVKSNKAAIGARITVTVAEAGGGTRSVHRWVTSGGSFGASPLEQHVGLGKAATIKDIEIWWPTSNTRQHFANVGKNQVIEITELSNQYRKIERPVVRLGGTKRNP
ncbi:MAG TPA: FG-GAP-like repeat-containing protein [Vicinamibacterales bacterium]